MTEPTADPRDRRMRLRYPARCRLCGTSLPEGAVATVERHLGTVRCDQCATTLLARPLALPPVEPPPPPSAPSAPHDAVPVVALEARPPAPSLGTRAPASALIAKVLELQRRMPPQTSAQRRFGADPLNPQARSWFIGALGELEVGHQLARLDPQWRSVHSLPVGTSGADIDHIAIGPAGVFTINTKRSAGKTVWVGARRLLVNGHRTDHLRNAEFEARRTAEAVSRAVGRPVDVRPLVVFVGARHITIRQRPERVVVLHAQHLAHWLLRARTVLTPAQVDAVHAAVTDPLTWGSPAAPAADLAAFHALRESIDRASRRRANWILAAVLGPIVVGPLVGFAIYLLVALAR